MRGIRGEFYKHTPVEGGYFWFMGKGVIRKVTRVTDTYVAFEERKRKKTKTKAFGTGYLDFVRACSGVATQKDWEYDFGRNTGK